MANTLTNVNSVLTFLVPGVFPVPQIMRGYATDDAFATEAPNWAETQMGVDGRMSAGFTPAITPMTITLQADSTSRDFFDTWLQFMKTAREIFPASGTIVIPSIGKQYTLTNGVLVTPKQLPDGKKILQPTAYVIHWERVDPALL